MRLEFQNIHKYFGQIRANVAIDLALESGQIYGLLGENGAGKTTLMRMLAGHIQPSKGTILFNGKPVPGLTPSRALRLGVGMLYQDPLDFPGLRVWENFSLGGERRNRRSALRRLDELTNRFHFRLPPEGSVNELTVGERQQLELLRLLDLGVNVLILDEPTTGISVTQREKLFATMRQLAFDQGRTIIFVTHKLVEAQELCQQVIVLRQGRLVGRLHPPFRSEEIITRMFGPEHDDSGAKQQRPHPGKEVVLRLEDAQFMGEKYVLGGISLQIRSGEILGLAGLEGSGQEILLRGLAGLVRLVQGRLTFDGEELHGQPYHKFSQAGIHFLPAARLEQGLFPDFTLREHFHLAFSTQRGSQAERLSAEGIRRFNIQAGPFASAKSLSGGNQQRLLLALIPSATRLLLLEHPTRGLDQGAGQHVWSHLLERCRQHTAVVFSSADLDEIKAFSHRVLVFYNRKLIADCQAHSTSVEEMGRLMAGQGRAA